MSNYDKETKFYWLQLKEDFFEDDAIEWLEEQKPNGRDYAYFYLKLCLKSLKSNGILIRQVGNILIPYDNQKLAELTKMDFDTVTVAMELLKQIGLVKILENGEIYITQLNSLIGSKSLGALKKQQQRLLKGQIEDKCPPKIEIELELKDKDINKNINNNLQKEFEELWKLYPKKVGKKKSFDYYVRARKKGNDFETIKLGIEKYVNFIEKSKTSIQYVKDGSTWFNQECWNDERKIEKVKTHEQEIEEMKERLKYLDEGD